MKENGRMMSILNIPCEELIPLLLKKGCVPLTA
jgi:hypothetical protein